MERPLFIPLILGTARQGSQSENVARFVFEQTQKRADVETELIDVRELPMKLHDAGEQVKDPKFRAAIERCVGLNNRYASCLLRYSTLTGSFAVRLSLASV